MVLSGITILSIFCMYTTACIEFHRVEFTQDRNTKEVSQVDAGVERKILVPRKRSAMATAATRSAGPSLTKAIVTGAPSARSELPTAVSITFLNEVVATDPLAPTLRIRIKAANAASFDMNRYLTVVGGGSLTVNQGVEFQSDSGFLLSVAHGNVAETTLLNASNVQNLIAGYGMRIAMIKEMINSNTWRYAFVSR